jgi:outer membrane lipoprotein carrier protein
LALQPFKQALFIELSIEKIVTQELLGSEKNYLGKIYFSKGLFRLETDSPEKTLFLYDGTWVWNVKYFDPSISPTPQISRLKVNAKNGSQMVLAKIIGKGKISEAFKLESSLLSDSIRSFSLVPKRVMEAKDLVVSVDEKSGKIVSIKYRDDLNNQTLIKILKASFSNEIDKSKFKFKPPKGVQVMNL